MLILEILSEIQGEMSRCRREACTETVEVVGVHQGERTEGENEQSQGQELRLEELHHLRSGQQT